MSGVIEQSKIVEKFNKFIQARLHLPHLGAIMFIVILKDNNPIGYISLISNWEKTKERKMVTRFYSYIFVKVLPMKVSDLLFLLHLMG